MSTPDASQRGVSPTRPRTSEQAPGRATRLSPRRACRRCARARSLEDLRGAVAALEAHLVGAGGAGGAVVEVDEEVVVDLHPTVGRAVDSQQPGAQPGVELVVPGRVQRGGDLEPEAVQGELEHLRPAVQLSAGVAWLAEHAAEPE